MLTSLYVVFNPEDKPMNKMTETYRVQIDEQVHTVEDPVITGSQLLDLVGKRPADEFLVFQMLRGGQMEEIRLDETVDLRKPGLEKFITFKSDRSFRLVIDGRRFEWGAPLITGLKLKERAGVDPQTYGVWLEVRGGEDRPIENTETVDLEEPGVERFFTAPQSNIEIIVNSRPKMVPGPAITFEQIVQLAFPGSHNPNTVFSITYRKAASVPSEGELGAGGSVKIKTGTIFNVTQTDKS